MAAVLHAGAGVAVAAAAPAGRFAGCGSEARQWRQLGCSSSSQLRRTGALRSEARRGLVVKAAGDAAETGVETRVSGDVLPESDWPETLSILNFEDLISHYEPRLFKEEVRLASTLY
jgi:hypothetical protein